MKYLINLNISLFLLLMSLSLQAQDQSGIIIYKGVVNEKFVDSFLVDIKQKDIPMVSKQRLLDAIRGAKPDEFQLNFKNDESYYYIKPALEPQGLMDSRSGTLPYYTNNATDTLIVWSSLGIIAHEPLNWKITNKTKTIGNYICYQATVTEKHFSRQGHYFYKDVVAWFTPEIPLNFGPKYYKGLPGLILQIEDKEYTLTAIKIQLNPSEDVKIKRLEKNDKVITWAEADNRIKEMESHMKKRYAQ